MAVAYISRPTKISIAVTTQPTNTEYIQGDTLDLTGLVVTATSRDGSTEDITSVCTFSPANGSTLNSLGAIAITATYHGKTTTIPVTVYELDRIEVTTPPTKTSYNTGEELSYSGIVVTAYANNDTITRDVTSYCSYSPSSGTTLSTGGTFSATISWRTKNTTQSYAVVVKIYGAEWAGGSSSAWTRTDDAVGFGAPSPAVNNGSGSSPFDNIMPWSGMRRVEESTAYTGNQVLVEIPKFYYKWAKTGSAIKLQIANAPVSGFSVSPAHANRGDGKGERDYVYVGAYHATKVGNFWYSYSGTTPTVNITRATARTGIHNTNSTQWQWDYAMLWTIRMLYLVEYADWNSQSKIGYGCGNGSSIEATGKTDAMIYHTGTNASSRSNYGHVRYRYIEDLWANAFSFVDGIYFNGTNTYAINNPTNFSDTSGGTFIAVRPTSAGFIKSWTIPNNETFNYALIPYEVVSNNEYVCDYFGYKSQGQVAMCGGCYTPQTYNFGLFQIATGQTSSNIGSTMGCRVMKLP